MSERDTECSILFVPDSFWLIHPMVDITEIIIFLSITENFTTGKKKSWWKSNVVYVLYLKEIYIAMFSKLLFRKH